MWATLPHVIGEGPARGGGPGPHQWRRAGPSPMEAGRALRAGSIAGQAGRPARRRRICQRLPPLDPSRAHEPGGESMPVTRIQVCRNSAVEVFAAPLRRCSASRAACIVTYKYHIIRHDVSHVRSYKINKNCGKNEFSTKKKL
jgi:hypothetical protein